LERDTDVGGTKLGAAVGVAALASRAAPISTAMRVLPIWKVSLLRSDALLIGWPLTCVPEPGR